MNDSSTPETLGKIAVIGMAGRFPGSKTIGQFWNNLRDGKECVSFFTDQELLESGVDPTLLTRPNYVKARGAFEGTYLFDASFFGYAPRDAELLDPQHRVFLECAWEALEDAGYDPTCYPGRIGLFAGSGPTAYLHELLSIPNIWDYADKFSLPTYCDKDFLATRVGYKLNLRGPCMTIQTACSTSLVSIVTACQNLLSFCCDMAMAGGVTLDPREKAGYIYKEGTIASPDGHCRSFDRNAVGTVPASGCGIVVLKRLEDAIADGDTIHAIVLGFGLNNDGSSRIGYAAPGLEGQIAVSSDAIAMAGINPETIGFIECHGTATPLGDPIEIAALSSSFRTYTQKKNYCAVGSVKTNLGHLDTAAGVAGFIKSVLALEHKLIPASLHFHTANPEIDFENSPFFVNTTLTEWKPGPEPRRAGVSSFGLGGTNAHLVLEEAPELSNQRSTCPFQLLLLSATTHTALEQMTANLIQHIQDHPQQSLADVAYTLQAGRHLFPHRRAIVYKDVPGAYPTLDNLPPEQIFTAFREKQSGPVAFLFPGQGPQHVNMGRALYQAESAFRKNVDLCAQILTSELGMDIREILYPPGGKTEEATSILDEIKYTTPILFTIEYSLGKLWLEWGLKPQGLIGHSTGEYAAACIAGVFSLEDALRLVCARGRLMQQQPHGAMTAVLLAEQEVLPLLEAVGGLSVAAINGASTCVISGPLTAMDKLEANLAQKEVAFRRLHISHASHSEMMDPILEDFRKAVHSAKLNSPRIPYVSNLTGTWIKDSEATDPDYWVKHVRQTVRFSDGLAELLRNPQYIFLEIGPGRMLSSLVAQHPEKGPEHVVLPSLPHPKNDVQGDLEFLLASLGQLWLEGVPIQWTAFHGDEKHRRVPLPTFPFQRQHYQLTPNPTESRFSQNGFQPAEIQPSNGNGHISAKAGSRATARHSRPDLSTPYLEPRNPMEHAIAELWQESLGIQGIGVNDRFVALGGHSLLAVQVVARIRKLFDIELQMAAFYRVPTIAGVAQTLAEFFIQSLKPQTLEELSGSLHSVEVAGPAPIGPRNGRGPDEGEEHSLLELVLSLSPERITELARESNGNTTSTATGSYAGGRASPLVAIRTNGNQPPLFLLHPVGGGVQPYFQLAEYLDRDQPVYALQNYEFGSCAEHPYTPVETMAGQYIQAIRGVQRTGPYVLGGWSMGGIVAFEMAIQLKNQGEDVGPLIMIDAPAQFVSIAEKLSPEQDLARELFLLGRIWAHQKKKNFSLSRDDLEPLRENQQLDRFIKTIKDDEIVVPEADDTALRAATRTFINNNRACEEYAPKQYPGPMIVIRAKEVQPETKEDTLLVFDDPSFGWQSFCSQPVIVHYVPGDHMFMMLEPHVRFLAATLQECMNQLARK